MDGGSVFGVDFGAKLTVKNGTVTGGARANGNGGGFNVNGTLIIEDVNVTGCRAQISGGGIFINGTGATAQLKGNCSIQNNSAVISGSGIHVADGLTLSMEGTVKVDNNKTTNVYLSKGSKIEVTGKLDSSSHVSVTHVEQGKTENGFGHISASTAPVDATNCFVTDNDQNTETICESSKLFFVYPFTFENKGEVQRVKIYNFIDELPLGENAKVYLNRASPYYVVRKNTLFMHELFIPNDGNGNERTIILCDGVTMTCEKGMIIQEDKSLNICAQKADTGKLICKGTGSQAGIGSELGKWFGSINIYGGIIEAQGGDSAAGIGTSDGGKDSQADEGEINIYGGHITAVGGRYGAGIGGGDAAVNINVKIRGGYVEAIGGYGSCAIGCDSISDEGYRGRIIISGGTVRAQGGKGAPGIGVGIYNTAYTDIEISGGNIITAGGENASGIGSRDSFLGNIRITGGEITAYGKKDYPAIGGSNTKTPTKISLGDDISVKLDGAYASSNERLDKLKVRGSSDSAPVIVNISKCTHKYTYTVDPDNADNHIKKCTYCNSVSVSELHDYDNMGICRLCGYKTDISTFSVKLKVKNSDGTDTERDLGLYVRNRIFILPDCDSEPEGYEFDYWSVKVGNAEGKNMPVGKKVTVTGDITATAVYKPRSYTITYNLGGGTNSRANPTSYNIESDDITLADPLKTGVTFGGWYDNAEFTGTAITTIKKGSLGDLEFYAKWTGNDYSVIFDGNGATSGAMSNQVLYSGAAAELSANAYRREFTVTYEYRGATGGAGDDSSTVVSEFDGWAISPKDKVSFTDRQRVVDLTLEAGGKVTLYAIWDDKPVILPTPVKDGVRFGGWYSDSDFTAKAGDGGSKYSPDASITLYAKWIDDQIIMPVVSISDRTYGDEASDPVVTGNDGNGAVTFAYKAKGAGDAAYNETVPTKPGEYTVKATVAAAEGYKEGTAFADFKINKKNITVTGIAAKDKEYDGGRSADFDLSSCVIEGKIGDDELSIESVEGEFEDEKAGTDLPVTILDITLGGAARDCYDVSGTAEMALKANIIKAPATDESVNGYAMNGAAGTLDLGAYVVDEAAVTIKERSDSGQILDGEPSVTNGSLAFKFKEDAEIVGKTATVTVSVTSNNFEDYDIIITLTATGKQAQNLSFAEGPLNKVYGDTAFTNALSGAQTEVTYSSSNASAATVDPATGEITITGAGETRITAEAAETDDYAPATASYTLNIDKAYIPAGAPETEITVPGIFTTVAGIELNTGWVWADPSTELPEGIEVSAAANYTASDSGNYKTTGVTVKIRRLSCTHNMTHIAATAATCSAKGNIEYWHCLACNKDFDDEAGINDITGATELDIVPHSYEAGETTPATCEKDGSRTLTCKICGESRTETIPAPGHDYDGEGICTRCGQSAPGMTFMVKFDANGGLPVPAQQVEKDANATEPATPVREGYTFRGWFGSDEKPFDFSTKITGSITLTAKWDAIRCTVTFDSRGGSKVEAQEVQYGTTVTEPAVTSEGFIFGGWMLEGSPYDFTTPVTRNITLTARWEGVTHQVTFYLNGKYYSSDTVRHNEHVLFPKVTPSEGKTVTCWCTDKELNTLYAHITPVTEDIVLYAEERDTEPILKNGASAGGSLPASVIASQGDNTAFTLSGNAAADKLKFPKAKDAKSIGIDGKDNALEFSGSANIKPNQAFTLTNADIKAQKSGKAQSIILTAAKDGMVLDDVRFEGKSVKINATKGDLILGDISSTGPLTITGNKKTKLVIEGDVEAASITGFGTVIIRESVTVTKALNAGNLIIEEVGLIDVGKGAAVTVKNGIDGYGEIILEEGFKPITLNGQADGYLTLTSDSQFYDGQQIFKSKLTNLEDVFDYSDCLPYIKDGNYEYGLYSKSGKVCVRAMAYILNGQPYCEWNDVISAINKAKNANAHYTLELLKDTDLNSGFKLPGRKKYASLTIDGNNYTIMFKGKSVSLTGDMTLDNVTVGSKGGAWTLKTGGFKFEAGAAELISCTPK